MLCGTSLVQLWATASDGGQLGRRRDGRRGRPMSPLRVTRLARSARSTLSVATCSVIPGSRLCGYVSQLRTDRPVVGDPQPPAAGRPRWTTPLGRHPGRQLVRSGVVVGRAQDRTGATVGPRCSSLVISATTSATRGLRPHSRPGQSPRPPPPAPGEFSDLVGGGRVDQCDVHARDTGPIWWNTEHQGHYTVLRLRRRPLGSVYARKYRQRGNAASWKWPWSHADPSGNGPRTHLRRSDVDRLSSRREKTSRVVQVYGGVMPAPLAGSRLSLVLCLRTSPTN